MIKIPKDVVCIFHGLLLIRAGWNGVVALEKVDGPIDDKIDAIEKEDEEIVNKGDADDFIDICDSASKGVIANSEDNKADGQPAFRPSVEAKAVHLSQDDHCSKTESEHRPHGLTLEDGDRHGMDQNECFEEEGPPLVEMSTIEK